MFGLQCHSTVTLMHGIFFERHPGVNANDLLHEGGHLRDWSWYNDFIPGSCQLLPCNRTHDNSLFTLGINTCLG